MSQKSGLRSSAEQHVREIHRQTRKQYSAEEKIRIVLEGLRGEYSIAELCCREVAVGLAPRSEEATMRKTEKTDRIANGQDQLRVADAIQLDPSDQAATLLRDANEGQTVTVQRANGSQRELNLLADVPQ